MSEIEMINRKITTLREQSLEKQRKLLLLRDSCYGTDHIKINQLEHAIKSLQESIACLKRAQNDLIYNR